MADNISQANSLAKLIGTIATEVFSKKPENPNTPLNRSQHVRADVVFHDDLKYAKYTASSMTHVWGPAGYSDELNVSPQSTRYNFTGVWA